MRRDPTCIKERLLSELHGSRCCGACQVADMGSHLGRSRPLPARGLVKPEFFSDEDWDEYFACRERYDRPVTLAEIRQLLTFYRAMSAQGRQKEALIITSKRLPLQPHIALYAKHHLGLKAIRNFNLYEARKLHPEEF